MKKIVKDIIQTVAATVPSLALLVLVACSSGKNDKNAGDEVPEIDVASVLVDSVTVHKTYPGYLTAQDEVDLVARVNGYLRSAPYQEGQFVRAGTVLFTIESSQYADAVRQATAALANAQAAYRYASSNYEAMQKALKSDAVSQMEVLQSKSAMEEAQAQIATARAALQTARTNLSYCTVRAPFDGHITKTDYSDGAYLAGAAAPVKLATLYDDSKLKANFSIDNAQYAEIQQDAANPALQVDMHRIPLVFDTPTDHSYTADLSYAAPAVDPGTGTLLLQARIDNKYNELKSGMYCKISMPTQIINNAILVRDASIGTDQLGKYVYVVNDSAKVVYTPIKVGETVNDTLRVVTSGLKRGDRYVTRAMLKVRDGMTVKPNEVPMRGIR